MIVVTGAGGFIAHHVISQLNEKNFKSIVAVDDFNQPIKKENTNKLIIQEYVHRNDFFIWLEKNHEVVEFVFHIGARTDTAERDVSLFNRLNLNYSKQMWEACVKHQLPLIYASSAATYGIGEQGFNDDEAFLNTLKPLNLYAQSKHDFDRWAIDQKEKPFFWAGLKFFNVYGPHESHKGRMASVVWHLYHQIKEQGKAKLFKSHRPDYLHGKQKRDFVYVKDVAQVCLFLMDYRKNSGLYNLGTGRARTFDSLTHIVFDVLQKPAQIEFIDIPADIQASYQYYTQAEMNKLIQIGYTTPFYSLEEGVREYIESYLNK